MDLKRQLASPDSIWLGVWELASTVKLTSIPPAAGSFHCPAVWSVQSHCAVVPIPTAASGYSWKSNKVSRYGIILHKFMLQKKYKTLEFHF